MIVSYHKNNYIGQNIIIVGTGNFRHQDLVSMVEAKFGHLDEGPKDYKRQNSDKPVFLPRT